MQSELPNQAIIVEDFRQARRKAALSTILARIRGENAQLLSYEEVLQQLQGRELPGRQLRQIRLDAVVGSVARYKDFTRTFLPKGDSQRDRWARIKLLMTNSGLPPIEVYDINGNYFVKDGNHRVSVAREMGLETIEAYVTPVITRVPLSAIDDANAIILKSEYAEFLTHTRLDETRPDSALMVSVPSAYRELLEHIDVHRYYMGITMHRTIPYEEAAAHWHDEVYLPVKALITANNLLAEFPERTEADLYLWITRHKCELHDYLGWDVPQDAVVEDLLTARRAAGNDGGSGLQHLGKRLRSLLKIGGGEEQTGSAKRPAPGKDVCAASNCLLESILALLDGGDADWEALARALELAQVDQGQIIGLLPTKGAAEAGRDVEAAAARFYEICAGAGRRHTLVKVDGDLNSALLRHSRLTDVFVSRVAERDEDGQASWSALKAMMQAVACPMLLLRGPSTPLRRVLLVSASGEVPDESLCTACYLAARADVAFTVSVLKASGEDADNTSAVRRYLEKRGFAETPVHSAAGLEDILALLIRQPVDCIMMKNGRGRPGPQRRPDRRRSAGSLEQRLLTKIDTPVLLF